MNSRKTRRDALRFGGSEHVQGSASRSELQASALEAEFAEMIAALPDAEPSSFALAPAARVPFTTPITARHPPSPTGTSRRKSPSPARGVVAGETPLEIDGEVTSQQIIEFLKEQNLFAVSQLRIEVHNGVAVATGEVSSVYEKQLLSHFCRQVPGVAKFVDGTVVRDVRPAPADPEPGAAPVRRMARRPIQWRLPLRAWHAGAAVALLVLVWSAISLGRAHGRPGRLAVYPVTGKVLVNGRPAAGAAIVLHPQDPSLSARPRAIVKSDGSLVMTTYEPGDGAPAGEYKATVEWRRPVAGDEAGGDAPPPANVLPPDYASSATTTLTVTVEEGENEIPPLKFEN